MLVDEGARLALFRQRRDTVTLRLPVQRPDVAIPVVELFRR